MKTAARALSFIRPHRGLFFAGQLATLAAAAAGLVFPLMTRDVIDSLVGVAGVPTLSRTVLILGGAFVLLAIFTLLKERSLKTLSLRVVSDLRNRVFEKIQRLPYDYFDRNQSGDLISIITNDVTRFQDSVAGGLSFLLSQSVGLVVILTLLFTIDAVLTLLLIALVPVFFVVLRAVSSKVRGLSTRVQQILGEITSVAGEAVRGVDVIKSYVLGNHATTIFAEKNHEFVQVSRREVGWSSGSAALSTLIGGVAFVGLIAVGGTHVQQGLLTPGELVAYLIYAQMIVGPIGMLSGIVVEVQRALAAIDRVFALLDAGDEGSDADPRGVQHASIVPRAQGNAERIAIERDAAGVGASRALVSASGRRTSTTRSQGAALRLESVRFGYDEDNPVLRDVSLDVQPGQFVALVGPSGAGKSTLIKLIVRFYEPQSGRILLDGVDVRDRLLTDVRREAALVMQETHLFDMTVSENLLCGRPDATRSEVRRAADDAQAAGFIEQLPEGFDSRIGENGTQLSGGQRQRLSLARAFLKEPRLLLLDEATSALDTESERRVQAALARLMEGRTTIAVAHRLSTVRHADRIFLMDQGRIVDSGPHDELFRRNDQYAELCRHQMIKE